MDIEKAKELYKNYQEKQKDKRELFVKEVFEKLEEDICIGKKYYDVPLYCFTFKKKASIEDILDEEAYYAISGKATNATMKFFYQNFISQGFKVSMRKFGERCRLVLSGWADDE